MISNHWTLSLLVPVRNLALDLREHRVGSVAKHSVRRSKLGSLLNIETSCDGCIMID